jgi:hypothetical protein
MNSSPCHGPPDAELGAGDESNFAPQLIGGPVRSEAHAGLQAHIDLLSWIGQLLGVEWLIGVGAALVEAEPFWAAIAERDDSDELIVCAELWLGWPAGFIQAVELCLFRLSTEL